MIEGIIGGYHGSDDYKCFFGLKGGELRVGWGHA